MGILYHYARLNEDGIVKGISSVSNEWETNEFVISIQNMSGIERRRLIGKKYNRETGEFEEVNK